MQDDEVQYSAATYPTRAFLERHGIRSVGALAARISASYPWMPEDAAREWAKDEWLNQAPLELDDELALKTIFALPNSDSKSFSRKTEK